MTMNEQLAKYPEWTTRTHVESWLTRLAAEAGEYAESALSEFGARLDGSGEADVSHLPDEEVSAILMFAMHDAEASELF